MRVTKIFVNKAAKTVIMRIGISRMNTFAVPLSGFSVFLSNCGFHFLNFMFNNSFI